MGMKTNVTEADEPMPFKFRFTDKDGEEVGIEVGDNFGPVGDDFMEDIGLRMVMMGLRLYGLSSEESKLIGALVIKTKG